MLDIKCEQEAASLAYKSYKIRQGYLTGKGVTVRVRKLIPLDSDKKAKNYLTVKATVNNRVVEVEKKIDCRDFDDLWSISVNRLEKLRHLIKHDKYVWEMDFLKDYMGNTYFSQAEVELPEGKSSPESRPEIVNSNLIYQVDLNDSRFSNKLLGDARYAANILKKIKNKSLISQEK